jgi:hypothetical protein
MKIVGVSVPVLTGDIERAIQRYERVDGRAREEAICRS